MPVAGMHTSQLPLPFSAGTSCKHGRATMSTCPPHPSMVLPRAWPGSGGRRRAASPAAGTPCAPPAPPAPRCPHRPPPWTERAGRGQQRSEVRCIQQMAAPRGPAFASSPAGALIHQPGCAADHLFHLQNSVHDRHGISSSTAHHAFRVHLLAVARGDFCRRRRELLGGTRHVRRNLLRQVGHHKGSLRADDECTHTNMLGWQQ